MISFELPNGPYYVGSELAGTLIWTPKNTKTPQAIRVILQWQTSGTGRWEEGQAGSELFSAPDPLVPGQALRFPFRFRIPAQGPVSYQGKLLRINWRISGEVDLPWALDERVQQDLEVLPRVLSQAELQG
jgi:hypothetical protein